jgi:Bacterial Ig domain
MTSQLLLHPGARARRIAPRRLSATHGAAHSVAPVQRVCHRRLVRYAIVGLALAWTLLLFASGSARAASEPPECSGSVEALQVEVGDLPMPAGWCFDADGDELTVTITQAPEKGTAEVVAQGTPYAWVQYSASAVGADRFTFKANDGSSDSTEATVTTDNVPAVDDPPSCFGLEGVHLELGEPGSAVPCFDEEGGNLTITITQRPQKGMLEVIHQGTPAPSLTYTATAIGADSFSYKANDGNSDSDEATTTTVNVDTTPPETTITAGPAGLTADSTPTFSFSSDQAGSRFQCRVDGDAWASCTSPTTLAALNRGPHNLEVRALDVGGNLDATPARRDFSIAAPTAPGATAAPGAAAAPDITAPAVSLGAKKSQKVGNWIRLVVTAINEDLWASVTGRVSVQGASERYKLTGVRNRFIARGHKRTLKATVSKKARAAMHRALRRHKKVKATLRLTLRDAAGNVATRRVAIKLKR